MPTDASQMTYGEPRAVLSNNLQFGSNHAPMRLPGAVEGLIGVPVEFFSFEPAVTIYEHGATQTNAVARPWRRDKRMANFELD
jgi:hypothetical protein